MDCMKRFDKPVLAFLWLGLDVLLMVAVAWFGYRVGGSLFFPAVSPGLNATQLACDLGLELDTSPLHPLWGVLVQWVVGVSGSLGAWVHLQRVGQIALALSAVCLYRACFGLLRGLEGYLSEGPALRPLEVRLAALVAPVSMMTPAVRYAAMAPHSSVLCVVFASVATLLATFLIEGKGRRVSIPFGAVCALGCLEAPGFFPVFFFLLIAIAFSEQTEAAYDDAAPGRFQSLRRFFVSLWNSAPVVAFLVVFLGGACWVAYRFQLSGAMEYRYAEGYLDCLATVSKDLLSAWKQSIPPRGFLAVIAGIYLPTFMMMRFSPWLFGRKPNVYLLLAVSCVGLAAGMSLNPHSMLYVSMFFEHPEMEIAANVLTALYGAFSVAYLWMMGRNSLMQMCSKERDSRVTPLTPELLKTVLSFGVVGTMFGFWIAGTLAKEPEAERKAREGIAKYVSQVVEDVGENRFLITDGMFDSSLRLQGRFRQKELVPLAFSSPDQIVKRKLVSRDLPTSIEREDYAMGALNLLLRWTEDRPERFGETSTLLSGSFWKAAGYRLVPNRTVLRVVPEGEMGTMDVEGLFEKVRPLWEEWRVEDSMGVTNRALRQGVRSVRNSLSLVANELGILSLEMGRTNLAEEAFSAACDMDLSNLAARYNLERIGGGENPALLRAEIQFLAQRYSETHPELLMRHQGTFLYEKKKRTEESITQEIMHDGGVAQLLKESPEPPLKLLQALLKKKRTAALHVRRILAPKLHHVSEENVTFWLLWGWCGIILEQEQDVAEARWYLRTSRLDSARLETLEAMLSDNPAETAERMASVLTEAPRDAAVLRVSLSSAMAAGRFEEGYRVAFALLQQAPNDSQALFTIGTRWLVKGDFDKAYTYLKRAERAGDRSVTLLNNLAEAAFAVGEAEAAYGYALRAHEALPENGDVLATLVKMELATGREAEARLHVEEGLRREPEHAELKRLQVGE